MAKKGDLKIEIHMSKDDWNKEKPYYWCICSWTGRSWYNTGRQGYEKTIDEAWEAASIEFKANYE